MDMEQFRSGASETSEQGDCRSYLQVVVIGNSNGLEVLVEYTTMESPPVTVRKMSQIPRPFPEATT